MKKSDDFVGAMLILPFIILFLYFGIAMTSFLARNPHINQIAALAYLPEILTFQKVTK